MKFGSFYQNTWVTKSLVAGVVAMLSGASSWVGASDDRPNALRERYEQLHAAPPNPNYAEPLRIVSEEVEDTVRGEAQAIFDQPFATFASTLLSPAHWCDILPLGLGVKACVPDGNDAIVLYVARKYYSAPEDAHRMRYRYRVTAESENYARATLTADETAWGVQENSIEIEALGVGNKTFFNLGIGFRYSTAGRIATTTYLATLGRGKIGFSVEGDPPSPVKGVKGMIERNVMRYYLAIRTYFETLSVPEEQRFEARIHRWFDATERYHDQLYEYAKEEYLDIKRREHANQLALQIKRTEKTDEP